MVSALLPAGPAASGRVQTGEDPDCFGIEPTITGTAGDDVIRGTNGFDVISGLEGNDVIRGRGGANFICAGDGDDLVYGGPSFDAIESSTGADKAFGRGADDLLMETNGPEGPPPPGGVYVHVGDVSPDEFYGGPGKDLLTEDGGNDLLDGGDGLDTFLGIFNYSPMVVDLMTGHVTSGRGDLNTLASIENAYGGLYADVIVGSEGPNVLAGLFTPDIVYGEGGADLLLAMTDGDVLDGGAGGYRDGILAVNDEGVHADLEEGVVTPRSGAGPADRILGIEDFIGGRGDDTIVGSATVNRLFGGGGDDMLDGASGNDVLLGDGPFSPWRERANWDAGSQKAGGEDELFGGEGRDRLDGGPAFDVCDGEKLRRCEAMPAEIDVREARREPRRGPARGLDAWWAELLLDAYGRPWLDLVPERFQA